MRRTGDLRRGLARGPGAGNTGVFVLGMHRSGTSALARVVNLLGVPLGYQDSFIPDDANPRGYWESRPLSGFQDRLLVRLGGSWAAPPRLEDGWERAPRLVALIGRGRWIFGTVYGNESLWMWKDPRMSLTLPFWLRALRVNPVVIMIHRHPLEVARSLETRSKMPKLEALALWERYNRAMLQNAATLRTYVTSYPRIVSDPAKEALLMLAFLRGADVHLPAELPDELINSFVESSLRHSAYDEGDLASDADITPEQKALAALLTSLEGAHDALPAVNMPPESPAVEPLLARRRALPLHGRRGRPDE